MKEPYAVIVRPSGRTSQHVGEHDVSQHLLISVVDQLGLDEARVASNTTGGHVIQRDECFELDNGQIFEGVFNRQSHGLAREPSTSVILEDRHGSIAERGVGSGKVLDERATAVFSLRLSLFPDELATRVCERCVRWVAERSTITT